MKTMTIAEQEQELNNDEIKNNDEASRLAAEIGTDFTFKRDIVWKNAIGFLVMHIMGLYGVYLVLYCHIATIVWSFVVGVISLEGITAGAHRLFSHRTYKVTFYTKLFFIILQTMAGQNCLYIWARDHRQHHKYSDTDADPHNAQRGFFFSHMGWLMSRKHPLVKEKGKTIDMSDFEADPLIMFQKEHYKLLYIIFAIIIPVSVPMYFWNETFANAFFISYMTRYVICLHFTWQINSAAHLWGVRPFEKSILPTDSLIVGFLGMGEGWHNYHHTFPWDYRASEFGSKYCMTTFVIDLLGHFGLAYDFKSATYNTVAARSLRTGDGTHEVFGAKMKRLKNLKKEKAEKNVVEKVMKRMPYLSHKVMVRG